MLSGVARDSLERDGVIEHKVREQASLFVGPRGIVGKVETVLLEGRPEEFGGQRVVSGVIPSDHDCDFQRTTNRVRILPVEQLHGAPEDSPRYLGKTHPEPAPNSAGERPGVAMGARFNCSVTRSR
jgi:hypothetical protein